MKNRLFFAKGGHKLVSIVGRETSEVHGSSWYTDGWGSVVTPLYLSTVFEYREGVKVIDRGTELKYSREENRFST